MLVVRRLWWTVGRLLITSKVEVVGLLVGVTFGRVMIHDLCFSYSHFWGISFLVICSF